MFQRKKLIIALASATLFAGCGGGGAPAAVTGKLIDGYLVGATVFCDSNGNGTRDANEESVTTDKGGVFTLTGGCDAAMIGSGGTDADTGYAFQGQLKAPAGSTVITPLTTLLASSTLTHVQLAEMLSLPAGTDIRTIDIANGQNQDLLKKTLAVQHVIDNLAKVVAESTGRTSSTDRAAIYASVASDLGKALATTAASNTTASGVTPFVSTSGGVNSSLLASVVKSLPAVTQLAIAPADLDAAINVLTAQAQVFASASDADLAKITKVLQDPVAPTVKAAAQTNFLALASDAFDINGQSVGMAQFGSGVATTGLSSLGFVLAANGTPAADTVSSVALELIEQGGQGRKLQLLLDKVTVKVDANGQPSVSVPAGAKVYAYGHTSNGTDINLTLTDLSFTPINVVDKGFKLNYANMVNKVLASVDNTTKTTAEKFIAIKGSFAVKVVISKLNVRHVDGSAIASQTIALSNTAQSVTGAGLVGTLIVN